MIYPYYIQYWHITVVGYHSKRKIQFGYDSSYNIVNPMCNPLSGHRLSSPYEPPILWRKNNFVFIFFYFFLNIALQPLCWFTFLFFIRKNEKLLRFDYVCGDTFSLQVNTQVVAECVLGTEDHYVFPAGNVELRASSPRGVVSSVILAASCCPHVIIVIAHHCRTHNCVDVRIKDGRKRLVVVSGVHICFSGRAKLLITISRHDSS